MPSQPQLTIGGHRTYDDLGLVLSDATSSVPEARTSYVDVPGRDGSLDLTAASGRVAYKDREDEYTFVAPSVADGPTAIWAMRAQLANLFDGLRADYSLSWEPGYTRRGRWSVGEMKSRGSRLEVTLSVRAEPYRSRGEVVFRANAAGGTTVTLPSGRLEVRPRIEVSRRTVVAVDGRSWELAAGTWVIDDMWLHQGDNVVTIDTTPEYSVAAMSDYSADALSAHAGQTLAGLAAGGKPLQESVTLQSMASDALWDHESERLIDMTHPASTEDPSYNAYFAYEWKDL